MDNNYAYHFGMPLNVNYAEYYAFEGTFLPHECERIMQLWEESKQMEAEVTKAEVQDLRRSSVIFLQPEGNSLWIYEKLKNLAWNINLQYYLFDITGFYQELQLTEYKEDDYFEWHSDFGVGATSHRKLSLTVQLSKPEDYEGGDLQFMINQKVISAPKAQGTLIAFPSYVLHRVLPVTKGKRNSIVGWVSGPPFR